jgi:hypothetical protein
VPEQDQIIAKENQGAVRVVAFATELLDGPWQTAENRSRPQNCIEEVELDVDACPELVPFRSPT